MTSLRTLVKPSMLATLSVVAMLGSQYAQAAIGVDRTRVILDGENNSVSVNLTNNNTALPYLAQTWIEDRDGNKISSPLVSLPPVQRIEPGAKSQAKIQGVGGIKLLPQDKESLFYFNMREIPPKSDKPNTLQIALQTRIKLFYRPAALLADSNAKPWQESVTLSRKGDDYIAVNPTPYFVTLTAAAASPDAQPVKSFKPVMIEPNGSAPLGVSAGALGSAPVLTYLNDYGGHPRLVFGCSGANCVVKGTKAG
ncbi:fimbria/pilus periplasmic chaperone [Dryocola sp. BD626]|jgi:chaperone protein PapD|uniref:fimbria/pilus periplasmic chaperone n=1 Tax=Dryocola sp. BD626 TaxID=3133273 RepID=UPI003F4F8A68